VLDGMSRFLLIGRVVIGELDYAASRLDAKL
jgi:hypothetical protein